MDTRVLDQRINGMIDRPQVDKTTLLKIRDILSDSDDWSLFRINPIKFSRRHNLRQSTVIDLFIYGVKFGLFDFSWNLICPACGGIEYSHASFYDMHISGEGIFHCTVCDLDVPANIDDQVEVSFTINKAIHDPDLKVYDEAVNYQNYHRYYRSENVVRSEQFRSYMDDHMIAAHAFEPMADLSFDLTLEPDSEYRLASFECHSLLKIFTAAEHTAEMQYIDLSMTPRGFSDTEIKVKAGPCKLHVMNKRSTKTGFGLYRVNVEEMLTLLERFPSTHHAFLTGKMLFNNQCFRDLFKVQKTHQNMHLQIRSLTLLFTDLKGSTAMYDEAGDLKAYELVKEHFNSLFKVVRQFDGAVVKTMGDAIMATFSTPHEGLSAALMMQQQINTLNRQWREEGRDLGLKVGLHEGPAMVVNANEQLDYFGQTVNVAARVQGLARSDEIWLSDAVYRNDKVQEILARLDKQPVKTLKSLKGVEQLTEVYCIELRNRDPGKALI